MCDVFNKFSLTYYSDVSQFSRRSFSNPVPSKRGAFTLARSPGGCRKEGKRRREASLDDDYHTLATVRYCLHLYLVFVCYIVFFPI